MRNLEKRNIPTYPEGGRIGKGRYKPCSPIDSKESTWWLLAHLYKLCLCLCIEKGRVYDCGSGRVFMCTHVCEWEKSRTWRKGEEIISTQLTPQFCFHQSPEAFLVHLSTTVMLQCFVQKAFQDSIEFCSGNSWLLSSKVIYGCRLLKGT